MEQWIKISRSCGMLWRCRAGLGRLRKPVGRLCYCARWPDCGTRLTQRGGRPHAEPVALADAGDLARGATVYVSLEPCAHYGASPPCTDALIAAGVARVVYALRDPDPRVDGAGHKRLSEAGIEVVSGVLEQEAEHLNCGFLSRIRKQRPFVTLKLATSLERSLCLWPVMGYRLRSRAVSHQMRARQDAIVTGIGTIC